MGKEYTEIDASIQSWIRRQHMYFVATAPDQQSGLVNCSPKGLDSLAILNSHQLAYADTGGSGIETVAHLKENGRITLMMCSFEGPPKIFRFYGRGSVIEPHNAEFAEMQQNFPALPAIRTIIVIDVERVRDACGFGVPLYDFQKNRDSLNNYFADKSEDEILDYRRERNAESLDGLPGLDVDNIGK